jgi:hypothetical protein
MVQNFCCCAHQIKSVTPTFDCLISGGWPSAIWQVSQLVSSTKAFFFGCSCAKKITCHSYCGSFWASLRVVRDLAIVTGPLFLSLFVALWIDDMILSFCVWLMEDEPPAVWGAVLSFRFSDNIFYFWCFCKMLKHQCSIWLLSSKWGGLQPSAALNINTWGRQGLHRCLF